MNSINTCTWLLFFLHQNQARYKYYKISLCWILNCTGFGPIIHGTYNFAEISMTRTQRGDEARHQYMLRSNGLIDKFVRKHENTSTEQNSEKNMKKNDLQVRVINSTRCIITRHEVYVNA